VASIDGTTIATALPEIVGDLGGLDRLPWVVTAYMLSSTIALPVYGRLADRVGQKQMFLSAVGVFVAGAIIAATSRSIDGLIAARAVQGLGAGGLLVLAQSIIAEIVSPRDRSRYLGLIGALFGLGSIAGPVIGGVIADRVGWRGIFLVVVPFGLAALAYGARNIPSSARRRVGHYDVSGMLLLASALTAIVMATTRYGGQFEWNSAPVLAAGLAAVVSLLVLYRVQLRNRDGILPLDLIRRAEISYPLLVALITGTTIFGLIVFTPVFLQVAVGTSPTISGFLLLPLMGGFVVSSIATGRAITRLGRYKIFPVVGTALLVVGFALLASMDVTTSFLSVSLYLALSGIGVGMVMQVVVLAVQNAVKATSIAGVTALAQLARAVGQTLGVAVLGVVLNSTMIREMTARGVDLEGGVDRILQDPSVIDSLEPTMRLAVTGSVSTAVTRVFALSIPLAIVAFVMALKMKELPLGDARTVDVDV